MGNGRAFKVDARALISLGRESIKDHTTALLELIKNCYDADAENVEVEISDAQGSSSGAIRIADDGIGMLSSDVDSKWLRVGYSEKRLEKVSKKGRRETGEKGIGRLSADRLGSILELRSQKHPSSPVGIWVDWDKFDVDNIDIGSVSVDDLSDPVPDIPQRREDPALSGTEIRIRQLRQQWSGDDIAQFRNEIATLVPPYGGKNDFKVWFKGPGDSGFEAISSVVEGIAELELKGDFDGRGNFTYELSQRSRQLGGRRKKLKSNAVKWSQLAQGSSTERYSLGRFSIRLSFFLRSTAGLSEGLTLAKLREYLDTQGGVKIYRDEIRVRPYGDTNHPDGDWLGLAARKATNPAGAGREDFRISANQLVGVVRIGRDSNPLLSDSAAREGLIHGQAYEQLKQAVMGCVILLEAAYHKAFAKRQAEVQPAEKAGIANVVGDIQQIVSDVQRNLAGAGGKDSRPDERRLIQQSVAQLQSLSAKVDAAEREIEELASQSTVYRGLATVGISAAVFGHETETALAQARLSCDVAIGLLESEDSDIEDALEELEKTSKSVERVELWGRFALARVRKDKRKRQKVQVVELIKALVSEVQPLFASTGIELRKQFRGAMEIRAFPMDLEALTLNLLTNAYYAASRSQKAKRVEILVGPDRPRSPTKLFITVSDSGAGIPKEYINEIWRPLFTTKTDRRGGGTGLGLTIVKSVCDEIGANVSVIPKGGLGGATFNVTIPYSGA